MNNDEITYDVELPRVNREIEIKEVRTILTNMMLKVSTTGKILNWFGIPGIGKTTLCHMVMEDCQNLNIPFCVIIDFDIQDNPRAKTYAEDYCSLLEDLSSPFPEAFQHFYKKLSQFRSMSEDDPEKSNMINKLAGHFIEGLSRIMDQPDPVVMMFDTTEMADESVISWLETEIFSPLCFKENWLIIWTGRFPQKWTQFEVRRRTSGNRIDALSMEATKDQIGKETGCRVYRLTWGHPGGNKQLHPIAKENAEELSLIKAAEKWVKEDILKGIDPLFVEICRVLSVVRRFDLNLADDIISNYIDAERPPIGVMTVIGKLYKSSLAGWDGVRKGYALDNTLRRVLRSLLIKQDEDRFIRISEHALEKYKEWIKKIPENKTIYILEWLYHKVNLSKYRKDDHPSEPVEEEFANYVKACAEKERDVALTLLNQLYEDLSNDLDLEVICREEQFDGFKMLIENYLKQYETD